jgi:sialic acid synthase SpsE
MNIDGIEIGSNHPPYLVAELSANHNGDYHRACAIVEAAAEAGADAIKIQVYDPIRLATARGGCNQVLQTGPWKGRSLLDLYKEGHTPIHWVPSLFAWARKLGITMFASVFDEEAVDFLEECECPAYKIASFELTNTPLIRKAAATGKPLILSTGMGNSIEISDALKSAAATQVALLHCVSDYPCKIEHANLGRIETMRRMYGLPIGWSDHTMGSEAAIVATALGACIIEKHLTLLRRDGGLDAAFSMERDEFAAMATSCRKAWLSVQEPDQPVEPYRHLRSVA